MKNIDKVKRKTARCRQVLAVLNNKLETLEFLREETYPDAGDFGDGPIEMAICRVKGAGSLNEVMIPMSCVVFLK